MAGPWNLADPDADRILFWDDGAGDVAFLAPGTGLSIVATSLDLAAHSADLLTSGTIPDARIQESGVTQHEAALAITASQISPEVAVLSQDEDITGHWDIQGDLQMPGVNLYNVKHPDHGAVGDGATDDLSAIQSAIDAAEAAGGGIVFFPASANPYLVSSTITVGDNITLKGASPTLSEIKLQDSAANGAHVIENDDTTGGNSNIKIVDLGVDGNKANQTGGNTIQGIRMEAVTGLVVRNCHVHDSLKNGLLLLNDTNEALVEGGKYYDNAEVGVLIQDTSGTTTNDSVRVLGVLTANNGNNGIGITESIAVTVIGCVDRGSATSADDTAFNSDSGRRCTFVGCVSIDSGARGFSNWLGPTTATPSLDNSFVGCIAQNPATEGFRVNNAQRVSFTGCKVFGAGTYGYWINTADVNNPARSVEITGGSVEECENDGIRVDGGRVVTISGVRVTNNGQTSGSGIRIEDDNDAGGDHFAANVHITGCHILDGQGTPTQTWGVRSGGSSDKVYVLGNRIEGNVNGAISLAGTNNETQQNPRVGDMPAALFVARGSPAAGASKYGSPAIGNTTEAQARVVAPFDGYAENLYVDKISSGPGSGETLDVTLKIAGSGSSLTVQLSGTSQTGNDQTNKPTFSKGDFLVLEYTASNNGSYSSTATKASCALVRTG